MITPEEFILKHAATAYDAAKRREYYLKTRELKGRQTVGRRSPSGSLKTAVQKISIGKPSSNREAIQNRREKIQSQVDALNAKLERLRSVLQGIKNQTGTADKKSEEDKKQKDRKEPTAAEKKDAAKQAKERRDKEAKLSPNRSLKEVQQKIEDVRDEIKKAREELLRKNAKKAVSKLPKVGFNKPPRKE